MADPSKCLPLLPKSISQTYNRIKSHIHKTPLITSQSLNHIASHADPRAFLANEPPPIWSDFPRSSTSTENESSSNASAAITTALPPPKFHLYLKLESHQKIGAFKARGAFSAITHIIQELGLNVLQQRGVITHSSGNHAQALALAASTFSIPAWIVMPSISTKSKIAGVRSFEHAGAGVRVVFSGSTAPERESKVVEVVEERKRETGGEGQILIPPYDHPDIILGQGTTGLEMEAQFKGYRSGLARGCGGASKTGYESVTASGQDGSTPVANGGGEEGDESRFDAILTPLGGGGLLAGVATWFSHTHEPSNPPMSKKRTLVFGCEPNFEGANDGERSLATGKRIEHVSTLTIADGLRTPVGVTNWTVLSNKERLEDVFSVSELEIKMALKLLMERVKIVVEPSAAVPVAVILFNKQFRELIAQRQKIEAEKVGMVDTLPWDVGVVLSGGNTTVEGLAKLFAEGWLDDEKSGQQQHVARERDRETGEMGLDGKRVAQDVAG